MQSVLPLIRSFLLRLTALLFAAFTGLMNQVEAANPIITDVYTADPAALVHDGRVYLYTGHDEGTSSYVMKNWLCFSSADMVNWKSEGSPLSLSAFSWAKQDAWAGHVIERNGKFYYYVPVSHKTINGFAIGVAVSDSPTGPFIDARGSALITNDMTVNTTGITWDDIDPTVFIDDDGQAYLFWGNTVCHYVKLKANMIELDGEIQTVSLPLFTEAPWVHKRNGIYYLSYAYGWEEKIAYATSTSITGPWTFRGVINDYVKNCNTNHQAIIDFMGKSYFIYHNGAAPGGGSYRRSVCIDYLNYNADGTILPIVQTTAGVSAVSEVTTAPDVVAQEPTTPTFTNVTVHDPSVIRDGASFYVFGSHMASASTTDLMNWTQITTGPTAPNSLIRNQNPQAEFSEALTWAQTTTFWAPDAIKLADGKYHFYYCACQGSSPLSALGVAVADAVTGPYANVGLLLKSGMNGMSPAGVNYNVNIHPNVVDPSVFFDNTGKLWMVYGSFSGGLFIMQLDTATGQPIAGQGYGKKLIGGNSSRIEGPYIIYSPESSYYYLFCTFGGLDAVGGYNIRVGRSRNPDGPYLDAAGNDLTNVKGNFAFDDATIAPYGVKVMGNAQFLHVAGETQTTSSGYVSPGGVAIYHDTSAGKYLMVFHTRFVGRGEQHEVRVHQLFMNDDGWFVAAPHRYAQETIRTTDTGQIVGDFKLINHGKAISATVNTSSVITLKADRTISGASSGTWQLSGEHNIILTLAGTSYHGVVVRQWDDDNKAWVLAFSALSGDGVAVWGSKAAVAASLAIATQPVGQSVIAGQAVTLTVATTGTPAPSYQWYKGGVAVAGATSSTLKIASAAASDAGSYTVTVTNSQGSMTSTAALVAVADKPTQVIVPNGDQTTQIVGLSTRGIVSQGENVLIAGFVITGSSPKKVLIRASGLNLSKLGLSGEIGRPHIILYRYINGANVVVPNTENNNWQDHAADVTTFTNQLQLQPFTVSSDPAHGDAGLVITLEPGVYSVVISPDARSSNQDGIGLIEIYDVTPNDGSRLVAISSRGRIETGARQMIVGAVVGGSGHSRLLIRGVGPRLRTLGVDQYLANPSQTLYRYLNGAQSAIAANDDWWNSAQADQSAALAPVLGALVFDERSNDAMILQLFEPGVYSAIIAPSSDTPGVAMAEIYEANLP